MQMKLDSTICACNTEDCGADELLPQCQMYHQEYFTRVRDHTREHGNIRAQVALGWAIADDAMGAFLPDKTKPQPIYAGLNWPVTIVSTIFTHTKVHVEEALLAAFNILLAGYDKLWALVPRTLLN